MFKVIERLRNRWELYAFAAFLAFGAWGIENRLGGQMENLVVKQEATERHISAVSDETVRDRRADREFYNQLLDAKLEPLGTFQGDFRQLRAEVGALGRIAGEGVAEWAAVLEARMLGLQDAVTSNSITQEALADSLMAIGAAVSQLQAVVRPDTTYVRDTLLVDKDRWWNPVDWID
jgi:hypothetical protein